MGVFYAAQKANDHGLKMLVTSTTGREVFGGLGFLQKLNDKETFSNASKQIIRSDAKASSTVVNKSAAYHNVEARIPYLDIELVRYVTRIEERFIPIANHPDQFFRDCYDLSDKKETRFHADPTAFSEYFLDLYVEKNQIFIDEDIQRTSSRSSSANSTSSKSILTSEFGELFNQIFNE